MKSLPLLVLLMGLVACGDQQKSPKEDTVAQQPTTGEPGTQPPGGDPSAEGATGSEVVEVERQDKDTVRVRVTPPRGLVRSTRFNNPTWQPAKLPPSLIPPTLSLTVTCNGSCDPALIPANIDKAIAGAKDLASRPNINTGDAKKDAVRADLEMVREDPAGDHRVIAFRVTYPPDLKGPYTPHLQVHCYVHRPGDDFFVHLSGRFTLAEEPTWLQPMLEACKALEIDAPPAP